MTVAISAMGKDINATVDPRMGRCEQFIIIDPDNMECTILDNPNVGAMGGAGIQTAQLLASQDIQAVITGNCGPNAFATFKAADIDVYIGASGTVQHALAQHKNGQLRAATRPNVGGHFGTGGRRGMGMGAGRSGDMGRGHR
jgi:predicted Fe-Mo cluster-binding NifX family protein